MKIKAFSLRNFKELMREPLFMVFSVALPIVMLLLMHFVMSSIGGDVTDTPQFQMNNFAPGIMIFSLSFISLFVVLLFSKDRATSFLTRLYSSPMKSRDYLLGYTLPLFPIGLAQCLLTMIVAAFLGLKISMGLLVAFIVAIPSILLFIGIGLLLGAFLSEKSSGPLSSVVVQITALTCGMWFPLDIMDGAFRTICYILPFANSLDTIKYAILEDYSKIWLPLLIVSIYALLIYVVAILVFKRQMKNA